MGIVPLTDEGQSESSHATSTLWVFRLRWTRTWLGSFGSASARVILGATWPRRADSRSGGVRSMSCWDCLPGTG